MQAENESRLGLQRVTQQLSKAYQPQVQISTPEEQEDQQSQSI